MCVCALDPDHDRVRDPDRKNDKIAIRGGLGQGRARGHGQSRVLGRGLVKRAVLLLVSSM